MINRFLVWKIEELKGIGIEERWYVTVQNGAFGFTRALTPVEGTWLRSKVNRMPSCEVWDSGNREYMIRYYQIIKT